jgi:DNA polymerase-3 subunit delta
MTFIEIKNSILKGKFYPVYFLHGEEDFQIDELSDYLEEKILTEDQKAFNFTVLYGRDSDFKQILDAARRYPVMSEYQVVIIKEAQDLKSIDELDLYLNNPLETTILIFAHKHKTLDKRKKLGKTLEKQEKAGKAAIFESKKLYDSEVPDWIIDFFKNENRKIDPSDAQIIFDYLGNDLSKIANELKKLFISVPKETLVTKELIQENIGISKDYDVFELQAALAEKNYEKSFKIVQYYQANPKSGPLPMISGILYSFFSKAYICSFQANKYDETYAKALGQKLFGAPRQGQMSRKYQDLRNATKNYSFDQIERILGLIKEYDLRSKGVGLHIIGDEFSEQTDHRELTKEMVLKILLL